MSSIFTDTEQFKSSWLVLKRDFQGEGERRRCWTMTWHHLATGTYFKHPWIWILLIHNSGVMTTLMKNIWLPQPLCHTHTAMCLVEARSSWFQVSWSNRLVLKSGELILAFAGLTSLKLETSTSYQLSKVKTDTGLVDRGEILSPLITSYCICLWHILDKMFNLNEIIREGSLQTGNKEEFFLMMPVPDAHFSKLMQR